MPVSLRRAITVRRRILLLLVRLLLLLLLLLLHIRRHRRRLLLLTRHGFTHNRVIPVLVPVVLKIAHPDPLPFRATTEPVERWTAGIRYANAWATSTPSTARYSRKQPPLREWGRHHVPPPTPYG